MAQKIAHFPGFNNYSIILDGQEISVINRNTKSVVKPNATKNLSYTLYADGGGKETFREKDILSLFNNMADTAANSNNMATSKKGGSAATRSQKQAEGTPAPESLGTSGVGTSATSPTPAQETPAAEGPTAEELAAEKEKKAADKKAEKEAEAKKKADESAAELVKLQAMPTTTKDEIKAVRAAMTGLKLTKEDRNTIMKALKEAGDKIKPEPKAAFVKANGEPRKVLTLDEIIQIREMLGEQVTEGEGEKAIQKPKYTIPEIAKQFGTLKRTIRGIRDGKRYAGVGMGEVGTPNPTSGGSAAAAGAPSENGTAPLPEQA